jgi:1-acyl-sn-glycerol-3-phosphate acyltransferase
MMAAPSGGIKPQKYRSKHPPKHYEWQQIWAREHDPDDEYPVYKVIKFVLPPLLRLLFRAEATGMEHIPAEGMVIIVPNHFSFLDHFVVAMFVPRRVRFMAKSQLFDGPGRWIFRHGGVFPVARGEHDEYAFETGRVVLQDKQQPLIMYVQGGRSRTHEIDGNAKSGVGKLSLRTGAPIVPVAVYGTQYLRHWRRLWLFPKIIVRFGESIAGEQLLQATHEQDQALSEKVFWRIKELYAKVMADVPSRWFHVFRP